MHIMRAGPTSTSPASCIDKLCKRHHQTMQKDENNSRSPTANLEGSKGQRSEANNNMRIQAPAGPLAIRAALVLLLKAKLAVRKGSYCWVWSMSGANRWSLPPWKFCHTMRSILWLLMLTLYLKLFHCITSFWSSQTFCTPLLWSANDSILCLLCAMLQKCRCLMAPDCTARKAGCWYKGYLWQMPRVIRVQ